MRIGWKHPKVRAIVGCSLLLGLLCLAAWQALEIYCQRLNTPPQAPIYPHSQLLRQKPFGVGTSKWPMVTYYYISTDPPYSVLAFYQQKGYCRESREYKRALCDGKAHPFGEYFVYIDLASYATQGTTSYALEVQWRGCTDDWD